jgi:hypothetical protein
MKPRSTTTRDAFEAEVFDVTVTPTRGRAIERGFDRACGRLSTGLQSFADREATPTDVAVWMAMPAFSNARRAAAAISVSSRSEGSPQHSPPNRHPRCRGVRVEAGAFDAGSAPAPMTSKRLARVRNHRFALRSTHSSVGFDSGRHFARPPVAMTICVGADVAASASCDRDRPVR